MLTHHHSPKWMLFPWSSQEERSPSLPKSSLPDFKAYLKIGPAYSSCLVHSFSCWVDKTSNIDKET